MKKIMFNDQFGLTKAVLEGCKTQTRRVFNIPAGMNLQIVHTKGFDKDGNQSNHDDILVFLTSPKSKTEVIIDGIKYKNYVRFVQPPYYVGDVLAIAQSYSDIAEEFSAKDPNKQRFSSRWISSMKGSAGWNNKMFVKAQHMPHHIRISNVRIERLQDISDSDCLREGLKEVAEGFVVGDMVFHNPKHAFEALIDKISKIGTWDSNPYVIVYDFVLVEEGGTQC